MDRAAIDEGVVFRLEEGRAPEVEAETGGVTVGDKRVY